MRSGRGRPPAPKDCAEKLFGDKLESFDSTTRFAKVKGVGNVYTGQSNKPLPIRHKIIADLCSVGMTATEAGTIVTGCKRTSASVYYNRVIKNPRHQARIAENLKDNIEEAKEILKGCVATAANNIKKAVDAGDYKASKDVLTSHAVLSTGVVKHDVELSFGAWLSQNATKEIDEIPTRAIEHKAEAVVEAEYADDPDAVEDEPTEGQRLRF